MISNTPRKPKRSFWIGLETGDKLFRPLVTDDAEDAVDLSAEDPGSMSSLLPVELRHVCAQGELFA